MDAHLWNPTMGPPGGGFHIISINPVNPDIMFVGSGYTFFRSIDGGDSWERVEQLHQMSEIEELGVQCVVFDPFDPSKVYVGTRGGLFLTLDNGENWEIITSRREAHTANEIAIDPVDPEIIYIVTSFGEPERKVFKSTNGGDTWIDISSKMPDLYHMNALTVVKHDELYIGIGAEGDRNSKLYHSIDGGETWHPQHVGQGEDTHVSLVRIDPNDSAHIYLGFADNYNRGRNLENLLFESMDGGETWTPVSDGGIGSRVSDIVFAPSNPDLIYYLAPLHRSRDGGKTWDHVQSWSYVQDFGSVEQTNLVIHPEDENILFATLMGQGIAKSTDGGETWWLSTKGMVHTRVTNLAAHPTEPGTLYASGGDGSGTSKTTDGGETWDIMNQYGVTARWVDELTICPSNPDIVYTIADVGRLFRTTNAGGFWEEISEEFHFSSIYAMAIDPNDPNVIYVMNNGFGMFKSEYGGEDWHYLLESPDYSYTISIDPSNTSIIYSGYTRKAFENESKIYRSTVAGERWETVLVIPESEAVTSVAVDPQSPNRIYAGATGRKGEIFYSDNRGDDWEKLNEDFFFSTIHAQNQLAVDPADLDTVYVSPWGVGLFKTLDGGGNWTNIKGSPTVSIACITVDPTDTEIIYVADRTKPVLWKSLDGGQSWTDLFDAGPQYSRLFKVKLNPNDPDTIYVSAFKHNAVLGSLFRIRDGETSDITGEIPRAIIDIAVDPTDSETIYVSLHGENVYKTTDGGEDWENLENMPITGVFDIEIDPNDTDVLYAAAIGGRRCPPELLPPELFPPVPDEDIGTHGVYKSVDGGLSWENINREVLSKPFRALVIHPDNPEVVYAGAADGFYMTSNGGDNWTVQNNGLDFKSIGALAINGNKIYAGTRGGGVYVGIINEADYTITWTPTDGPVPEIHNIQLLVDPMDSDTIYASSYPGGMFKTTDGGKTWKDKNFFLPSFEVVDPLREGYYRFIMDPSEPNRLYFGIYGKGVYVSNDGANSQMPLFGENNEMRGAEVTDLVVHPLDSDTIYAATDDGVYVTKNRGSSWAAINEGLIVPSIKTLAIDVNGKLYAGSKGYGVYSLNEDTESWEGPFHVQNFGVSWHVWGRPLYLYNALLINPFDPDIMYLGTFPTGFFKTTDGGETWHEHNTNFTVDGAFSMAFHPYNKSIILAGTYNGVSKSEDAGETWMRWDNGMPPELWVFSVVYNPADPDIIYASAKNGQNKGGGRPEFRGAVLKTVDGGRHWSLIMNGLEQTQEYYQLVMYPYNYDILFVSAGNGVFMTRDGGENWEPINDGLERARSGIVNNVANNLVLDADAKYLYIGTMGRGVYKAELEKLELEKDPDVIPSHCFNYVQDGNETGVDTGESCAVGDGEYDYGLIERKESIDPVNNVVIVDELPEEPDEKPDGSTVKEPEDKLDETPDETIETLAEESGRRPDDTDVSTTEETDGVAEDGEEENQKQELSYTTIILGLVFVIVLLVIAYVRK